MTKIPSQREAHKLLEQGGRLNPGPWVDHSIYVGKAAQNIAKHHPALDSESAYVFGCLHDIGRRFGISHMRHVIDGYRFMNDMGYKSVAKICLTHSFHIKNIGAYFGKHDCSKKDLEFISDFLDKTRYSEYDLLIQLCDALATPEGFCIIEKRIVDVALRNGLPKLTLEKWRKMFEIKNKLEKNINKSIYNLLPGIEKNSCK